MHGSRSKIPSKKSRPYIHISRLRVNPYVVPLGLCDPSPISLTLFLTVTNTNIAFYVYFRKPFLTMSHTLASFCVFPFIVYVYFHLRSNGTHSTFHLIWTIYFCEVL